MAPVAGYIAQVTFQFQSGLPRDVSENVFHFIDFASDTASVSAAEQVVQRLADFYTVAGTSGHAIEEYLSGSITSPVKVKVYDFGAGSPRPILYQDSFALTIAEADTGAMPPEVALCISSFGTINVKRQRGRQYIGPFNNDASQENQLYSQPAAALVTAMVEAGARLSKNTGDVAQASTTLLPGTPGTGPAKALWATLSKIGTGTKTAPAPLFTLVDNGWVDNEWDAQRRRRIASTSRQTWAPS